MNVIISKKIIPSVELAIKSDTFRVAGCFKNIFFELLNTEESTVDGKTTGAIRDIFSGLYAVIGPHCWDWNDGRI